jgi:hypothetical protein
MYFIASLILRKEFSKFIIIIISMRSSPSDKRMPVRVGIDHT